MVSFLLLPLLLLQADFTQMHHEEIYHNFMMKVDIVKCINLSYPVLLLYLTSSHFHFADQEQSITKPPKYVFVMNSIFIICTLVFLNMFV